MAAGKSNFFAKKVADWIYSATSYTPPATLYFGLWTTTLTAASTGSSGTECSYTGYARVAVTNNATQFPAATGTTSATKSNANAITFPSNGGSGQTVIAAGVCDASSAGNMIHWGDVASTVINALDTPSIGAGSFVLAES